MDKKLNRLNELMQKANLDAMAFNPGPNLAYLSGLHFHLSERPVLALFTASGQNLIVLPHLEMRKMDNDTRFTSFAYIDDPATWQGAFTEAFASLPKGHLRIGVEPMHMRVLEENFLKTALPQAEIIPTGPLLAELRLCKDENELAIMREAALIAQRALLGTLAAIRPGWTETQIAGELMTNLFKEGSEGEAFGTIVGISENAANPHATPGDRALREGDFILFDYGAHYKSYNSDITRTFSCGPVDPEFAKVGELVCAANRIARENGKPGMQAGRVDALARSVIEAGGYGPYFTHRLGHGLGMEVHEDPYIFPGNPLILKEGMVFTIEPGIYLPGKVGVRIEDDVVVTKDGLCSLTDLPREVLPLETFWK